MKTVVGAILTLILVSTATANAESKPKRDPVPGGARADHEFYKKWERMIKDQKFPLLPAKASEIPLPDLNKASTEGRQRYIFHMDVNSVHINDKTDWDGKYYNMVYNSKEFGVVLLLVMPKYRKCFDDLKKKFDQMQWVVFVWSEWDLREEGLGKVKQLALEYPRQCLGQLKTTGSKLKDAVGELE